METELRVEGRNLVFAAKEKDQIISTLSVSPDIGGDGTTIYQIKNAFTKGLYRRRGYMDAILKDVFACLQSEQEAFVFLGTREPAVFAKYGFVDIVKPTDPFPNTLGRIVDVKSFLKYFESEKEFVLSLQITDEMLPENDGIFMVHCGPTGGRLNSMKISMAEIPESGGCEKIAAEAKVDVSDLIQFGFGLKSAKEAFKIAVSFKEEELFKALDNLKFKQTV
ncbi:MAG: GNAT family N-acetyltransferase [Lachnospiraceae bacterium]|nr:GNAT family N-acetyltransferase [Lachnospiraceae bacterium]